MYKLENGLLKQAPNKVEYNGQLIFNPSTELLVELGYKELKDNAQPIIDITCEKLVPLYTETDTLITRRWRIVALNEKELS